MHTFFKRCCTIDVVGAEGQQPSLKLGYVVICIALGCTAMCIFCKKILLREHDLSEE